MNSYDFRTIGGAGYSYQSLETASVAAIAKPGALNQLAALLPTTSAIIGTAKNALTSRVNGTTSIDVPANGLLEGLFARRVFRTLGSTVAAPLNGLESGRILARFSDIKTEQSLTALMVKVFVNAPDVSGSTSTNNPNFAGGFSFFGFGGHAHAGHAFVVDLTDALRAQAEKGAIGGDQISIQLVPQVLDSGMSDLSFTVRKIELVAA